MTRDILTMLAQANTPLIRFDAGEKIFYEGDAGDCLFVVASGRVHVITYGDFLEDVEAVGVFGELALVDRGPRAASALAMTDTALFKIDRDHFKRLVQQNPDFALDVLAALAGRFRRITKSLRETQQGT